VRPKTLTSSVDSGNRRRLSRGSGESHLSDLNREPRDFKTDSQQILEIWKGFSVLLPPSMPGALEAVDGILSKADVPEADLRGRALRAALCRSRFLEQGTES
jgi:hypothetical protein